jgi:hypothetical protein
MIQAWFMDKSYKHNLVKPLVHRDCHKLPKPHMGTPCSFMVSMTRQPTEHEIGDWVDGYETSNAQ